MSTLPALSDLLASVHNSQSPTLIIANALSLLFEPSPTLLDHLVPEYTQLLKNSSQDELPTNYTEVVDQSLGIVQDWTWFNRAAFVGGHPRIGEVKGLSALSSAEQGQANGPGSTPPEVLARLAHLNAIYEKRYPGLIYVTFVNGRSRAQIRDEIEEKLTREGVLPAADEEGGLDKVAPLEVPGEGWCKEIQRAVGDVGKIAKSRLQKLIPQ